MKKLIVALLTLACAICTAFAVTACKKSGESSSGVTPPPGGGPHYTIEDDEDEFAYKLNAGGESYSVTGLGEVDSEQISIPATHEGLPVTAVADDAFNGSTITAVRLPEGLKTIGAGAFSNCPNIVSIKIPDSVEKIGDSAFFGCVGLKGIILGNGIESIAEGTFQNCNSLASITVPDNVTSIGERAFQGCSKLVSVTVGGGVEVLCASAFRNCTLLTSVTLGNGLKTIEESAFSNCKGLKNIVIPDSVEEICFGAFESCTALESITLPFVGAAANGGSNDTEMKFDNGKELTNFGYIFGATEHADNDPVKGYVPSTLKYITVNGNSPIPDYSLSFCYNIVRVGFGDGVKYIGTVVLGLDEAIKELVIGKGVVKFGDDLFYWSKKARTVYYAGTEQQWAAINKGSGNEPLSNSNYIYFYSENYPFTDSVTSGNFWHYDDGEIAIWEK